MEALSRMGAWQVLAARIHRELDGLKANLSTVPDIDKLRQLQGSTQALEGLLKEVNGARETLHKQG
jgi:hypothetical protein